MQALLKYTVWLIYTVFEQGGLTFIDGAAILTVHMCELLEV